MGSESGQSQRRGAIIALTLFIALATLTEALFPAIVEAKPNHGHRIHAQIVGGKTVPQGTYTFMAFVRTSEFDCGGSLTDPSFVLTAAHCVEDSEGSELPPEDFTVFIGKSNRHELTEANERGVVAVFQHPEFDSDTLANDVAVLELDVPVPSSIAEVLPIVGSGDTEFDRTGQPVVVAGWGTTSENSNIGTAELRGSESLRLKQQRMRQGVSSGISAISHDLRGIPWARLVLRRQRWAAPRQRGHWRCQRSEEGNAPAPQAWQAQKAQEEGEVANLRRDRNRHRQLWQWLRRAGLSGRLHEVERPGNK